MSRKGLVESIDYPGYYHVRGYDRLVMDEHGRLIDTRIHHLDDFTGDFTGDLSGAEWVVRKHKPLNTPRRKPVPIVVINTVTGDVVDWESTNAFAFAMGSNKNTIQKSIGKNNGRWRQYQITYVKSR